MAERGTNQHRRSIRLEDYDYTTPAAYFVTVCTNRHRCLFGSVEDGRMVLNAAGEMVKTVWNELPEFYPRVKLDEFVVMPNHFHGLIILTDENVGAAPCGLPKSEGQHPDISGPLQCLDLILYIGLNH